MNSSRSNILLLIFVMLFPLLQGCQGNVREKLGLKKEAPDEFMVISHPPLSMPPTFSLEAPGKSSAAIKKSNTVEEAKQTLFKAGDSQPALSLSSGEKSLLKNAGVDKADSNIRDILKKDNEGTGRDQKEEKGFFKKITDFVIKKKDPIVDAEEERKRLLKNKAEGKKPNEGEVPTIEQEGDSVIDQLLE